ncbi:ATP-binding cassette domain-containing protein [Allosaccharopolyspora coralli]|uniref:ATP-binding cassette domain-containing protein n=1 Tax=Allosaccharopolyspora coralli TaxID=2665642 RepID=A0A5Q3Q3B8_9PSEU|nr:ATP-binding cassette domain-containing protein [Allosaccharopolyspora coralli]QGK69091.1 ATP-binding cassette domain-containing protein [Allosaccharopolyspora coralli]
MGFVEAAALAYRLGDGRELFEDVSFRVSAGDVAALVGDNGAGKTTLLRMLSGELPAASGAVNVQGGLAVMPQFIGSVRTETSVRDLLLTVAPSALQRAANELDAVELRLMDTDDEATQFRYAEALTAYAETGGYDAEVVWDAVTVAALGISFDRAKFRDVRTLSGGEQKRLVLEALLRGREQVLLLDEPDNYLDVPGKRWLEQRLAECGKAVLLVSHDRELLAAAATHIVSLEGHTAWVHGGGFGTWHEARAARTERMAELRRRWEDKHEQLKELVRSLQRAATISDEMASRYRAAQTRLRKFEEAGQPPLPPKEQVLRPRLLGSRTGKRAITCESVELTGLMHPFDLEVFFGDRVCALGSNGSGKSHFLRLLDDPESVRHTGSCRLGARVKPGLFAQTHEHPEWLGRSPVQILGRGEGDRDGVDRGSAMGALSRYGLAASGDQPFETLSGGQQARFQVLLLELAGASLLLLDEPTDNLDLVSAEALQQALTEFTGTVVAVTHDRWFARSFDRFLVFRADGAVTEEPEPVWDEGRVQRTR